MAVAISIIRQSARNLPIITDTSEIGAVIRN